jgi:hypothetical protein
VKAKRIAGRLVKKAILTARAAAMDVAVRARLF